MVVLVTCKYKDDPIKKKVARMFTTLYINFADAQSQITLEYVMISIQNSNSSKLSWISSLPTRMKIFQSKMKEVECSQHFLHYKSMFFFSRGSRAANSTVLGPIWPSFELI